MPACFMDGTLMSMMNTRAASGDAARIPANPDNEVMGVPGAGIQGITQNMTLEKALPSLEIHKVFDADSAKVRSFPDRREGPELAMEVQVTPSAAEILRESDITTAAAREAHVQRGGHKPGALHHVGLFRDTPPEGLIFMDFCLEKFWLHAKHRDEVLSRLAVRDERISGSKIRSRLADIITGDKPGRKIPVDRVAFNPLATGMHDVSEVPCVVQNALKKELGCRLVLRGGFCALLEFILFRFFCREDHKEECRACQKNTMPLSSGPE